MTRQRGAALMIMLMIAGVLGAMFAIQLAGRAGSERAQLAATTQALDEAREALMGFAVVNGRLPRPAISGIDGNERPPCGTDETICTGLVPWVTLGVPKLDAWAKILRYSVTPAFANAPFVATTTGTKRIQTRDADGNLIDVFVSVPAVLFSHGKANFGTTDRGTAIANLSTTNADEASNNTGAAGGPLGTTFVQREATVDTDAPGGEFDDIVTPLLRSQLP
jgi:type II secretory pathway pseudopilin PulG